MINPFTSAGFVALGRLTSLVLSPDGSRLVAVRQEPDAKGARYASALWQLDLAGEQAPVRLTRSDKGETSPAFRPDGSLLFVSARPEPGSDEDEAALWELPALGEPRVVARTPGGVTSVVVARQSGTVLFGGDRLAGSSDVDTDRAARRDRDDRKLGNILHDGFPIRQWDRELDEAWPRLFTLAEDGPRELAPGTRQELVDATVSLCAQGRTAATTWRLRRRRGRVGRGLALLDVGTGEVRLLASEDGYRYGAPAIAPDGRHVAAVRETEGDFDTPMTYALVVFAVGAGTAPVEVPTGDLYPHELVWSGDGSTLVVSGDWHGRGAVLAVEAGTWTTRQLATDAVYSSICVDHCAESVYALRSSPDRPQHPVRLGRDGTVTELVAPDLRPQLPGRLTEIEATGPDGAMARAWLCLPHEASPARPVPLQLWIHGGPFASFNSWSWRWCPWLAVARGYAVLLPDPALSTGYGAGWLARAWPHRAADVWADVEALLDEALRRPELDATRTACLGASFGGYMTNWIAGHTDRFGAIVTHAGLWALDQQHTTTDAAHWKSWIFGTQAEHPEWYAQNSPHHFIDAITTPMLVVHGNRDYRVPVGEALRLWWDLVSHFDGEPNQLPHRFLQFTNENHWILSPGNAQTWYDTVLDFVDQHLGMWWTRSVRGPRTPLGPTGCTDTLPEV
jgi:dipeptidyl aminopeptidase/acylaminoacyl peptidase